MAQPKQILCQQHLQPKSRKCRKCPQRETPKLMQHRRVRGQQETKNFKYALSQGSPNESESLDRNKRDDHAVAVGVTTHGLMYVDAEVQTILTASEIQSMEDSPAKSANRKQLKRDMFLEDACKNDRSVQFYTGIPSLAYLSMLFNFLKSMAAKIKYWDGKKKSKGNFLGNMASPYSVYLDHNQRMYRS